MSIQRLCVSIKNSSAIGAKYKWREGKILHASRLWKSPTKRRIPRMLIEGRAMEMGILLYIEEPWLVFEETTLPSDTIDTTDAEKLEFYYERYHLLPAIYKHQDTYDWLKRQVMHYFCGEKITDIM